MPNISNNHKIKLTNILKNNGLQYTFSSYNISDIIQNNLIDMTKYVININNNRLNTIIYNNNNNNKIDINLINKSFTYYFRYDNKITNIGYKY